MEVHSLLSTLIRICFLIPNFLPFHPLILLSLYLFVLKLFFAFGLAFEVPVATVLMVRMGVTTTKSLAAKRPYIIVGAFVVGMLLTPPDLFSQTMLAIPVWILFEIGLYISKVVKPRASEDPSDISDDELEAELER